MIGSAQEFQGAQASKKPGSACRDRHAWRGIYVARSTRFARRCTDERRSFTNRRTAGTTTRRPRKIDRSRGVARRMITSSLRSAERCERSGCASSEREASRDTVRPTSQRLFGARSVARRIGGSRLSAPCRSTSRNAKRREPRSCGQERCELQHHFAIPSQRPFGVRGVASRPRARASRDSFLAVVKHREVHSSYEFGALRGLRHWQHEASRALSSVAFGARSVASATTCGDLRSAKHRETASVLVSRGAGHCERDDYERVRALRGRGGSVLRSVKHCEINRTKYERIFGARALRVLDVGGAGRRMKHADHASESSP